MPYNPWENSPVTSPYFVPSPTVEAFIHTVAGGPTNEFRMINLTSSRGEGKTCGAVVAIMSLGERLAREGKAPLLPIIVAIIRDTFMNLERTTLVSLEEMAKRGLNIQWRNGRKEAVIPHAHLFFFGADTREDLDKLQGFSCGILWPEEVAPAADLTTGIPPEVVGIGITAVRQPGIPKRIIMTYNPPDEDSWLLSIEKFLQESGQRDIRVVTYTIPPGEKSEHFRRLSDQADAAGNSKLAEQWREAAEEFDAYRRRNQLALESIGRHDLVQRLVYGRVGGVALGESVVPEFCEEHVTKEFPVLYRESQLVRSFDFGLSPTWMVLQVTPSGMLDVLGSRIGLNMSIQEHLLHEVDGIFRFQKHYKLLPPKDTQGGGFGDAARSGWLFRDLGDPAGRKRNEATRSEHSAALAIERLLHTTFEPGPVHWSARRDALHLAFSRKGLGDRPRFIQIYDKENGDLIKALRGRCHYPVDPNSGRITESLEGMKRVSGIYSGPVDALGYAVAMLSPAHEWPPEKKPVRPIRPDPRRSWLGG